MTVSKLCLNPLCFVCLPPIVSVVHEGVRQLFSWVTKRLVWDRTMFPWPPDVFCCDMSKVSVAQHLKTIALMIFFNEISCVNCIHGPQRMNFQNVTDISDIGSCSTQETSKSKHAVLYLENIKKIFPPDLSSVATFRTKFTFQAWTVDLTTEGVFTLEVRTNPRVFVTLFTFNPFFRFLFPVLFSPSTTARCLNFLSLFRKSEPSQKIVNGIKPWVSLTQTTFFWSDQTCGPLVRTGGRGNSPRLQFWFGPKLKSQIMSGPKRGRCENALNHQNIACSVFFSGV